MSPPSQAHARSGWFWSGAWALTLLLTLPAARSESQTLREPGAIRGQVLDAATGRPVEWVQVVLVRPERGTMADAEGRFTIGNVQPGTHRIKTFRIGYRSEERVVSVPSGDTVHVVVRIAPTVLGAGEVVVEAEMNGLGALDAGQSVDGRRLRQKLGTTIAETLDGEPGIGMRSMGPAPARPVLRGLGGERLLVLEDGGRTGDLSATSTDHAVIIEPITAERIDVIRGPQALQYGSSALGGVVNVSRNYVPTRRPDGLHGSVSAQGQSVNRGVAFGARLDAPAGPFALQADGSLRRAEDVRTPVGRLSNTDLSTVNGSLGASHIHAHGFFGIAGSYYGSEYGIPGGFVGAHPRGVTIEVERQHLEARADLIPHRTFVSRYEARASFSRYHHQEFEAGDRLGIEFGVLTYDATVLAHTTPRGILGGGAVGVWAQHRDYASGGFSFTPASVEQALAGFAHQRSQLGPVSVEGGIRFDYQVVSPAREEIAQRRFSGASASLLAAVPVARRVSVGSITTRSLRMPGIEELYSEGPHLAAYSFEVGNPLLGTERGIGQELVARVTSDRLTAGVSAYLNLIDGFIFPRNTGLIHTRTLLPIYQYSGERVRMVGAEGTVDLEVVPQLALSAAFSFVRGTLLQEREPLPWMPPLGGRLGLRFRPGRVVVGGDVNLANRQERVGEFEEPTAGYAVLRGFAQVHVSAGGLLHTIDLVLENVTDATYRDHLSRVKSIMPEPGRNVKLLYKVFF